MFLFELVLSKGTAVCELDIGEYIRFRCVKTLQRALFLYGFILKHIFRIIDNGSSSAPAAVTDQPTMPLNDDELTAVGQAGNFSDLDVILATTSQIKKTVKVTPVPIKKPAPAGKQQPTAPKAFAKIAPKPKATQQQQTAAVAANTLAVSPGVQGTSSSNQQQQFVYIQSQNGKAQQIRLATTSTASTIGTSASSTITVQSVGPTPISGNIQLIKSSDGGSFIQLNPAGVATTTAAPSPAGAISSKTTTTTSTKTSTTSMVLKNSGSQRVVLSGNVGSTPPAAAGPAQLKVPAPVDAAPSAPTAGGSAPTGTGSGGVAKPPAMSVPHPMPRTLTVAQAQQMGLLTPAKLKELVNAARAQKIAKQQSAAAAAAAAAAATTTASEGAASQVSPATNTATTIAAPTANTKALATVVATKPAAASGTVKSASPAVPAPAAARSTAQPIGPSRPPRTTAESVAAALPAVTVTVTETTATATSVAVATPAASSQSTSKKTAAAAAASAPPRPVTIQSLDGSKKHVLLPPNLYKMAQQGQIQAVNVAGKGVQLRINANAPAQSGKVLMISNTGSGAAAPAPAVPSVRTAAAAPADAVPVAAAAVAVAPAAALQADKLVSTKMDTEAAPPVTAAPINGRMTAKLLKPKAEDPEMTVAKAEPMDTAESAVPTNNLKRKLEVGGGVRYSTVLHSRLCSGERRTQHLIPPSFKQSSTGSSPAMLLNRTLKMEETIDPETLTQRFVPPTVSRRSIVAADGKALHAPGNAGASSVFTYAFDIPHKLLNSAADVVTATMVDNSGSALSSSQPLGRSTGPSASESEAEGPRRKHCNCTKSQCLKLYCDCFANGEFCKDCNCKDCFNNIEYEEERQKAIRICLERNPHAFK